jgi:hypothetical protein
MEAQDVFHALAEEVRSGDEVVLTVPGDAPGAVWIDGVERMDGDSAPLGRHLVQVKCEDGHVAGAWYELGAPPADWFSICDGSAYSTKKSKSSKPTKTTSKARPEPEPKAATTKAAPRPEPEPEPEDEELDEDLDEPVASVKPAAKSAKSTSSATVKPEKKKGGGAGKDIAGISLIALSAAGGVGTWWTYQSATQATESWEAKQEAAGENPELEPKEYREDVVVPRYNLFYATAGGTALLLAGGITLVLVDDGGPSFAPVPGGGALLWNGRF